MIVFWWIGSTVISCSVSCLVVNWRVSTTAIRSSLFLKLERRSSLCIFLFTVLNIARTDFFRSCLCPQKLKGIPTSSHSWLPCELSWNSQTLLRYNTALITLLTLTNTNVNSRRNIAWGYTSTFLFWWVETNPTARTTHVPNTCAGTPPSGGGNKKKNNRRKKKGGLWPR